MATQEACDWPIALCTTCDDGGCLEGMEPEQRDLIERAAVTWLWNWTGRRFGLCAHTIRPCREPCGPQRAAWRQSSRWVGLPTEGGLPTPALLDGEWFNLECGRGCAGGCSCTEVCEVVLPGIVHEVSEVLMDGVPLLAREWRLDNRRRLVRVPHVKHAFTEATQSGQNTYTYDEHGQWFTRFSGWGDGVGNPALPTSETVGDLGQVQWPPGIIVGGQYLRVWVPPLETLQVDTPERGVTIGRTPYPDGNGVHDDAAGTYAGGSDGMEYTIRFDGDQSVSFLASAAGFEVREVGWYEPGGTACWPDCQDMTRPSSVDNLGDLPETEGTWQVTYQAGFPVPAGGQIAAGVLACELAKACVGSDKCQLPRRITSVTRQGVSMALLDAGESWENPTTGLWLVDSWVASVNEPQRRRGGAVFVPGSPSRRSTRVT